MPVPEETLARLAAIPQLRVSEGPLLSQYTRFGIGGPARMFAETADEAAFIEALAVARASGMAGVMPTRRQPTSTARYYRMDFS